MKSKGKKSRWTSKAKPRTVDQARGELERADAKAKAAKEKVRATKSRLKAAKKALRVVEKVAKKARKEARRAGKTLKVLVARQRARKKAASARPDRPQTALESVAPEAPMPAPVASGAVSMHESE
jgi:chromosome segregation ATPase